MGHVENRFQVNELAMKFAFITGGSYVPLHAPTYVQSVEIKDMLTQDYSIRDILHRWETLDIALVGIGAPIGQSPVLQTDYLSQEEIGNLCRQKAVGDVCTRFFGAMGQPCLSGAEERTIGIDLETLRRISLVVGVAEGEEKVDSIRAAIAGGYVNALVTDDFTADGLLSPAQGEEDG
jgi:DNA-binding transcriptional regulator LsrR (DeoR family)